MDERQTGHLTDEQLGSLKAQLEAEKELLIRKLEDSGRFGLDRPLREVLADSTADNHPADDGTETFERSKDLALADHFGRMLDRIDQALSAIGNGSYGVCAACGRPIPFERLEAVPYTRYCVGHAREQFVSASRPVEEEGLALSLLRAGSGGRYGAREEEYGMEAGEDAWRIVESWGTASSPALAEDAEEGPLSAEADESEGFVEPIEQFVATDLYGRRASVVRSREYRNYLKSMEGEPLLEPDPVWTPDWADDAAQDGDDRESW